MHVVYIYSVCVLLVYGVHIVYIYSVCVLLVYGVHIVYASIVYTSCLHGMRSALISAPKQMAHEILDSTEPTCRGGSR